MRQTVLIAGLLAVFSVGVRAQEPDGKDIATAIPIYFDQTASDIADSQSNPVRVYKITLAKGQQFTVTASTNNSQPDWTVYILRPSAKSVYSASDSDFAVSKGCCSSQSGFTETTLVPTAGTYYAVVFVRGGRGVSYKLRVLAEGTPIAVPNPATAGCLTGKVDSMLFSLQRIGAGLPDEVTIGSQRACATCTVKPPLYSEISSRLEGALRSGVNVEACYDSAGSIFQLKLLRQ